MLYSNSSFNSFLDSLSRRNSCFNVVEAGYESPLRKKKSFTFYNKQDYKKMILNQERLQTKHS